MSTYADRERILNDAERDVAFALVKLQERNITAAAANLAVAFIKVAHALSEKQWNELKQLSTALVSISSQ